jgi:hypothetical protein
VSVDEICVVFCNCFGVCNSVGSGIVGKNEILGPVAFGKGGFDVRCLGAVEVWVELWDFLVRIAGHRD